MITVDIPGFNAIDIEHLVSDFSGTLSEDGTLFDGVKERLNRLAEDLTVHILTSDTFGSARHALGGINCSIHILDGTDHDMQKERYVKTLDGNRVVALGNGNNDRRMLSSARVGIAVCLIEGCATSALTSADIVVTSPLDALDLLLNPKRLTATLRF